MDGKLRCPGCGNGEKFYVRPYVERHVAVFDGAGQWVGDLECYDSELADDPTVECAVCAHEGPWGDFEE